MSKLFPSRRVFLALGVTATLAITACASIWETYYTPVGDVARNWRVVDVDVTVPRSLTVSETNRRYIPDADIVWQGEPAGDRYAQVETIMEQAITAGSKGLNGSTPVRFEAVVKRFHMLNLLSTARAPLGTGVENAEYEIRVVDARTGAVIVPFQLIKAEFPGLTGSAHDKATELGESQRDRIIYHIYATTRGWLGTGPDNRQQFTRAGG